MTLDCQKCDSQLQKERGCFEKGIVPHRIEGETYFRCPLKLITRQSWDYIKAYNFYKGGFLPNKIAWGEESNKVIDAISLIQSTISKIEKDELDKAQKRPKHGKRPGNKNYPKVR